MTKLSKDKLAPKILFHIMENLFEQEFFNFLLDDHNKEDENDKEKNTINSGSFWSMLYSFFNQMLLTDNSEISLDPLYQSESEKKRAFLL